MSSVDHVDECAVRWWRGYVKSCFLVVVDSAAPADGILMSPLFWSLRKSSLTAEGPIAAAHQQLVEKLQRQGWQPAGVGAVWYEQRFLREAHELTAADAAPPILEAPSKPARPVEADDRSRRAGTKRAPAPASGAAATPAPQGSPKPSSPAKLGKPSPRVGSKPTNARGRRGAPIAHGPAIPRAARTVRVGSLHRAPNRRARQLGGTVVVVGWAAVVAEVAALLALTGS
jgi:hypothetical protein